MYQKLYQPFSATKFTYFSKLGYRKTHWWGGRELPTQTDNSQDRLYIHFAVDLIVGRVNHRYNLQCLSGNWFPLILFRFLCSYYTFSRIRESVLRDQKNFINSRRAVDICGVHLIYSQEQLRHCFQRWPTTKKVICTKFYDSIRGHRINLVGLSGHIRKLDSDILGEDTAHLSSTFTFCKISPRLVSNCRLIFTKVVKYIILSEIV